MVAEVRERFGVSEAYRNVFSPPTQPAAEPLETGPLAPRG